jgi:hypothetical protein
LREESAKSDRCRGDRSTKLTQRTKTPLDVVDDVDDER